MMTRPSLQRGFTLVEVVIVIVITGIIGAVIAVFIRWPVQGYADSVARAELTDTADTALRRMARDLRLALPNSVRVTSDAAGNAYLELLLTKSGGRYLAEDDGVTGNFLEFEKVVTCTSAPEDCQFEVVGPMPEPAINTGDFIVVYNLGTGLEPANAYNCNPAPAANCNRARVTAVDQGNRLVTLADNPFAAQAPAMTSPSRRFQVVTSAVTYRCAGNSLTRHWGYTIAAAQPASAAALATGTAAQEAVLANGVTACRFDYNQLANTRSSLVGLNLTLTSGAGAAGTVVLFHQVHVDNTP